MVPINEILFRYRHRRHNGDPEAIHGGEPSPHLAGRLLHITGQEFEEFLGLIAGQ
ncbi:MAG: hypothetical protein NT009_07275 [Proteobacteria bacterium]|nr:hypothetical protein [Pseudomonadota bacterium]